MQTRYDYQLFDDGGLCTAFDVPILVPVGTEFLHEYGKYNVTAHILLEKDKIEVHCERLYNQD